MAVPLPPAPMPVADRVWPARLSPHRRHRVVPDERALPRRDRQRARPDGSRGRRPRRHRLIEMIPRTVPRDQLDPDLACSSAEAARPAGARLPGTSVVSATVTKKCTPGVGETGSIEGVHPLDAANVPLDEADPVAVRHGRLVLRKVDAGRPDSGVDGAVHDGFSLRPKGAGLGGCSSGAVPLPCRATKPCRDVSQEKLTSLSSSNVHQAARKSTLSIRTARSSPGAPPRGYVFVRRIVEVRAASNHPPVAEVDVLRADVGISSFATRAR